MSDALIPVEVGDGLIVHLLPRLPWNAVAAMKWDVKFAREARGDLTSSMIMGILSEGYLLYGGIAAWNLKDDKGEPLPVTIENVRSQILDHMERANPISEIADDLYNEQVVVPLAVRGAASLPPGSTNGSTSVTTGSSEKPLPKRSKRSSTSTSLMAVTETISSSPDGDSTS